MGNLPVTKFRNSSPLGSEWHFQTGTHQGTFDGEQIHAHDDRSGDPFEGRDVVVIGAGNSAIDTAVEASHPGQTVRSYQFVADSGYCANFCSANPATRSHRLDGCRGGSPGFSCASAPSPRATCASMRCPNPCTHRTNPSPAIRRAPLMSCRARRHGCRPAIPNISSPSPPPLPL
ncbi:NAD(P)-binding domain-containing protein [Arthrobacter sp. Sr24]